MSGQLMGIVAVLDVTGEVCPLALLADKTKGGQEIASLSHIGFG